MIIYCTVIVIIMINRWLYIYISTSSKYYIYICITLCPPFLSLGWTTIHACTPRFGENIYIYICIIYIIIYIVCVRHSKKSHACTRHVQIKTCTASRPGGKLLPPCIWSANFCPIKGRYFILKLPWGKHTKDLENPGSPRKMIYFHGGFSTSILVYRMVNIHWNFQFSDRPRQTHIHWEGSHKILQLGATPRLDASRPRHGWGVV
jgi:hypothetical protein